MHSFTHQDQVMTYALSGDPSHETAVIWAHGWGTSHHDFTALAAPFQGMAAHYLIDFPGFGQSPVPQDVWSPKDYAAYIHEFVKSLPHKRFLWVGHSFGCRVGINLAAQDPDLCDHMILIAAAGLPRQRSVLKHIEYISKVYTYKTLKRLMRLGVVSENWLKSKFGSTDYKQAGAMRDIMVATVNEHLTSTAPHVTCPVTLIYGEKDDQTPVSMGKDYERLIPNAKLVVLDGYDHYTILTQGRHQIAALIKPLLSSS